MAEELVVIPGDRPVILVAPHGGRRDAERRPWASARRRMNDLHTASLTVELAARAGAPAIINEKHDRNDVDLNRIVEAHAQAPWFLERLAATVDAVLARHARVTLLALHGWNVVQPVVDLGVGCRPGDDPFAVGRGAAVSSEFAASALRSFVRACAGHGIDATVGARYPARNRENLVQLFTTRYRDDPRPAVRALARHAARVDAVQLELGIPLRWPGAWRARFLAALEAALPAMIAPGPSSEPVTDPAVSTVIQPGRLQFTGPELCGLVAVDRDRGGRLLLFPPDGGLLLFTGERLGLEAVGTERTLRMLRRGDGGRTITYRGPLLRFPDTLPFLDLEAGLARAELVDADVALVFAPDHPECAVAGFGRVSGRAIVGDVTHALDGDGFAEDDGFSGPWPRVRTAMRLADGTSVAVTVGLDGRDASGFVCRNGRHDPVSAARAEVTAPDAALEAVALDVELESGERLRVALRTIHRLPVVRSRAPVPIRIEFAACGLVPETDGRACPSGWVEAAGL
ncbi:MAG TPA: hypothetical protein VKU61_08015 [Candidatus Binatia bacterium]|nr:hypothetical protein [Candidatus Binatia bacterium]